IDPMLKISPEDNYIIRHTGGTTGPSKGVAFTHRAWLACGRDWFYNYPPVEPGDRCLHLGPISHGSGYLFVPIWVWGGCNVMLDRFEASAAVGRQATWAEALAPNATGLCERRSALAHCDCQSRNNHKRQGGSHEIPSAPRPRRGQAY